MPRDDRNAVASWSWAIRLAQFLCLAVALSGVGCSRKPRQQDISAVSDTMATADARLPKSLSGTTTAAAVFVDAAPDLGIDFTATNGEEAGHFSILETLGVGVAWIDVQNDGRFDVFIPGGGGFGPGPAVVGRSGQLFLAEETHFAPAISKARLNDDSLYSHAAVVADYDHDGFDDVLVTGYGGLRLFQNCGDGTFQNVAAWVGLELQTWSTGAAWGDLNRDGNLDLYVTNYLDWSFKNNPPCFMGQRTVCSPIQFRGLPDALFFSDGAGGFRKAKLPAGAAGKGLAAMAVDLDLDGDLDVYVANDTTPNLLFENDGHGLLTEVGIESGTAFGESASSDGSMGIDSGDFNLDGLPDLWVANFEGQSFALYQNMGSLVFKHVSSTKGITSVGGEFVGFGTAFFDFDFDGDEDIVTANGHVTRASGNAPFRQLPLLFENLEGKRFANIASQAGQYFQEVHVGRGLALADMDGDADIDIAIAHTNEPLVILRNETPGIGNWVRLRLVGRSSPRTPVGAIVRVRDAAGRNWTKTVKSGASYLSSSEPVLTFGLGAPSSLPLELEVRWPSGLIQILTLDHANQELTIVEPKR